MHSLGLAYSHAVYAMENGKHVACEVPISRTIDEACACGDLRKDKETLHDARELLFDFFELLTLNMARQECLAKYFRGGSLYS
jgi:hypothetical protein